MSAAPATLERILVTRLRYAGDVILSLPLVAALGRALPAASIHYLVEPMGADVLAAQPGIDRVWVARRGLGATLGLAAALRRARFDAVIDLFCNPRSALLVRATGAPIRVGEDRRVRRAAYTLARRLVPGRSAIDQHLDALRGLGQPVPPATKPELVLTAAEEAAGRARWRALAAEPGVILHLGATAAAKEWPAEHAAELCRRLAADGLTVALTTAPLRPEPTTATAALAGRAAIPVGAMAFRDWLGFARQARAVVTVDGAPAHAAVALARPTVALFGPTEPRIWFPYERFGPYRVLHAGHDCAPCDRRLCPGNLCMRALAPADVHAAVQALLAPRAGVA